MKDKEEAGRMSKTAESELLRNAKSIVSQCDRCGACLPVCRVNNASAADEQGVGQSLLAW